MRNILQAISVKSLCKANRQRLDLLAIGFIDCGRRESFPLPKIKPREGLYCYLSVGK